MCDCAHTRPNYIQVVTVVSPMTSVHKTIEVTAVQKPFFARKQHQPHDNVRTQEKHVVTRLDVNKRVTSVLCNLRIENCISFYVLCFTVWDKIQCTCDGKVLNNDAAADGDDDADDADDDDSGERKGEPSRKSGMTRRCADEQG